MKKWGKKGKNVFLIKDSPLLRFLLSILTKLIHPLFILLLQDRVREAAVFAVISAALLTLKRNIFNYFFSGKNVLA